jgi:hypothetical protein
MRGEGAKQGWDGAGVCFEKRLGGAGREGKGGGGSSWMSLHGGGRRRRASPWRGSRQRGAAGNDP